MQTAFFAGRDGEDWKYRPEIVKAFADKEGIIDIPQAVYDTHAKIALVRGLSQDAGTFARAGGGRSAVAADVLAKMGYTNVSSLAGGLAAYQAAGLPVDKSSPPK
jgi:rhodanese-related sulfurtransferase